MAFYRGTGGTGTGSVTTLPVQISEGGTGATTAANARTNLGLSTMALQSSNNVSITGGTVTGVSGVVSSVNMTVPTGLSVSGGPITSTGTFAVAFSSGYSIPTTAKQTEWDTAYGWGNHASAGYLTSETYLGTVTSVSLTVPTGLTVSGSPITSSGTLAVSFDTGYSIPTTSSQSNWNTAYGWGNHASAGYLTNAAIGVTVQGYDADTAKYDDVTANFSGTLQKSGNNVLTTVSTISGGTY